MVQETTYADGPNRPRGGVVRYLLAGSQCVFSGVTDAAQFMTTINAAEHIIRAIAEAEKLDPRQVTFYDLMTRKGYSHLSHGGHEFVRLKVDYRTGEPKVTHWEKCTCPNDVLRAFDALAN